MMALLGIFKIILTAKCWRRLNPANWWSLLEMDRYTLFLMMKAALAPTIVIALAQIPPVSHVIGSATHIAAVISVTSHCLMPRGKFVKVMLLSLLALALAVCVTCLALITAVKAGQRYPRVNVDPETGNGYSSDAHTVCAIWLIAAIWLANAMRSWRPIELQSPVIAFSIFTNFNITRFGNFATFHAGLNYALDLLKSILIGFAAASVVSLLVLPMTSRTFFLKNARDYALQVQEVLQQQAAFVRDTTENPAVWFAHGLPSRFRKNQKPETEDETNFPSELHESRESVRVSMLHLASLFSKLQTDMFYSKQEFAIGRLHTEDIIRIEELLGSLSLPVAGISTLPNILDMHIRNERHYQMKILENDPDEEVLLKQSELQKAISTLHEHLSETSVLAANGIQYFLLSTKLMSMRHFFRHRKRKAAVTIPRDEESRVSVLNPLEPYFVVRFEHMMHETFRRRRHFPGKLASLAFDEVKDESSSHSKTRRDIITSGSRIRLEFFLVLYMGHMQDILLHTTHELVKFADSKVADNTLKSYRVILPKHGSLKRWFSPMQPGNSKSSESTPRDEEVHLPDSEHMPPESIWEKSSHKFRLLHRALISEHSLFGFRVAAASLSVGILAFLHSTNMFFYRQRLVWVMILIVIGMNPTTGETFFGLTSRIIGSAISVALCLGIWYAVDEKTTGIIILLYFANITEYWFYVKRPQLLDSSVIAIATLNEIIAAELEERKQGEHTESGGVRHLPVYVFGPYKLAAVAVACGIMAFWTAFPWTNTAKHKIRRMLGDSIFVLAEFYSAVHTNSALWLSRGLGDGLRDPQALQRRLEKVIRHLFRKEMILLDELRTYSYFSKFEPAIGGKFPRKIYDDIISEVQSSLTAMSLMVKTTQSLEKLLPFPITHAMTISVDPTTSHEQHEQRLEHETEQQHGPQHEEHYRGEVETQVKGKEKKREEKNGEKKEGGKKEKKEQEKEEEWFSELGKVALQTGDFKSARLASHLSHLSASVTNNLPLPPYLFTPSTFPLSRRMQKLNKNLLHVRSLEDPAFSAFITMEVLRSIVAWCMRDLLSNVRKLVGEVNFEYHVSVSEFPGEASRLVAGGAEEESEEERSDDSSSSSRSGS